MRDRDEELKRQLGTLWRTALVGLDTMREVVVRSTQTGRLRVDIAMLHRERAQLLESLGEIVMRLVDDGEYEDAPESVMQTFERIKDVEGRLKNDSIKAHDNAFGAPRGYEPEAASDYGAYPDDDASDEDGATSDDGASAAGRHNDTHRPDGASRRAKKKPATTKRKESSR